MIGFRELLEKKKTVIDNKGLVQGNLGSKIAWMDRRKSKALQARSRNANIMDTRRGNYHGAIFMHLTNPLLPITAPLLLSTRYRKFLRDQTGLTDAEAKYKKTERRVQNYQALGDKYSKSLKLIRHIPDSKTGKISIGRKGTVLYNKKPIQHHVDLMSMAEMRARLKELGYKAYRRDKKEDLKQSLKIWDRL